MSNRTKRLGRLGNSVVPEIAEWTGRRILEFDGRDEFDIPLTTLLGQQMLGARDIIAEEAFAEES